MDEKNFFIVTQCATFGRANSYISSSWVQRTLSFRKKKRAKMAAKTISMTFFGLCRRRRRSTYSCDASSSSRKFAADVDPNWNSLDLRDSSARNCVFQIWRKLSPAKTLLCLVAQKGKRISQIKRSRKRH